MSYERRYYCIAVTLWKFVVAKGQFYALCRGLRPSGPPHEPAGNERTALRTSDSDTRRDVHVCEISSDMINLSIGETGCFCLSATKTLSVKPAGLSSKQRILNAALILPSSTLDVIAADSAISCFSLLVMYLTLPLVESMFDEFIFSILSFITLLVLILSPDF